MPADPSTPTPDAPSPGLGTSIGLLLLFFAILALFALTPLGDAVADALRNITAVAEAPAGETTSP